MWQQKKNPTVIKKQAKGEALLTISFLSVMASIGKVVLKFVRLYVGYQMGYLRLCYS